VHQDIVKKGVIFIALPTQTLPNIEFYIILEGGFTFFILASRPHLTFANLPDLRLFDILMA
jgi:hypothetical protein